VAWSIVWWRFRKSFGTTTQTRQLPGSRTSTVGVRFHRPPDDWLAESQPTSSFRPSFLSSGSHRSSTSHTLSSDIPLYLVNGEVPGALKLGAMARILVRGDHDLEADPTGSVVKITVVVPRRPLLPTQRMNLRLPDLKDKAEVQASGRVWRQAVSVHISITEPHNPTSNSDRRLMTRDYEFVGTVWSTSTTTVVCFSLGIDFEV